MWYVTIPQKANTTVTNNIFQSLELSVCEGRQGLFEVNHNTFENSLIHSDGGVFTNNDCTTSDFNINLDHNTNILVANNYIKRVIISASLDGGHGVFANNIMYWCDASCNPSIPAVIEINNSIIKHFYGYEGIGNNKVFYKNDIVLNLYYINVSRLLPVMTYSIVYNESEPRSYGTGTILGDPKLGADNKLLPGSPCIGSGENGVDMGVYGGPYGTGWDSKVGKK